MIELHAAGVHFVCPRGADPIGKGLEWTRGQVLPWFDMMRTDGTHTAFFHVTPPDDITPSMFCEVVSASGYIPWFGSDEIGPCFFFMMDDVTLATARLHFCVAKRLWGTRATEIGRSVTNQLLSLEYNGRRQFQALLGETPAYNRSAIAFALRCGFRRYGVIPRGLYVPHKNMYVDRVLTIARMEA